MMLAFLRHIAGYAFSTGARALLPAAFAATVVCADATPDGETPLHQATFKDRTEEAVALLAAGAAPDAANRYGVTPMQLACANGNAEIVAALLEAGVDPNTEFDGGQTALMVAARTGRVEPITALLSAGAGVGVADRKGQTALMWAAAEGHVEATRILLEAGADPGAKLDSGFNAMFFAARAGHSEVVETLLGHGVDVNDGIEGGGGGRLPAKGTSALLLAMENGHFELAAKLLEKGADASDMRSGYTPLHVISWVRKPRRGDGIDGAPPPTVSGEMTGIELVDELVRHGADVNARLTKGRSGGNRLGRPGSTPFLLAARTADLPLMKALVRHGADFRLPNRQGRTPLLAAAGVALGPEADEAATEDEAVLAVRYLLELGADIDVVDEEGDTVMHAAAYKQAPKLVRLLAEEGADIGIWNRKNKRGWTPLLIAQGFRYGNFKPSAPTIEALGEIMLAAGVEPPPAPPRPVVGKRKDYP